MAAKFVCHALFFYTVRRWLLNGSQITDRLYLAYNAVHTPITPCPRWEEKLRHIENPVRRAVASMMAAMDEDIGKLREHLRERGLAENTRKSALRRHARPF